MFLAQAEADLPTLTEPAASVIEWATFGVACFAALMAVASLLVGVWQQRRQHDHEAGAFLREKRLEAYTEMYMHQSNTAAALASQTTWPDDLKELLRLAEIDHRTLARFQIVATAEAREATEELTQRLPQLAVVADAPTSLTKWVDSYIHDTEALAEIFRNSLED